MADIDESKCIFLHLSKSIPTASPGTRARKMWNGTVFKNREDACVYDEELGVLRMADVSLIIEHNGKRIKLANEEINHFISALNQLQSYIERDNQEEKAKEVSSG